MTSASHTSSNVAEHTLIVIKRACMDALDDEEPDATLFRAVVDPGSVWALASTVERLQHENKALLAELAQLKK